MSFAFSQPQQTDLASPLDGTNVKTRGTGNKMFSYVEAWKVIDEANRIFGFGGWNLETVTVVKLVEMERKVGKAQLAGWSVGYMAKVRITVGDPPLNAVVREGTGCGTGIDVDLVQAHENAVKEAESDAMKRALRTFGNKFGLALYDKQQTNVDWHADETAVDTGLPRSGAPPRQAAQDRQQDDEDYVVGFAQWMAAETDAAYIHEAWSAGLDRHMTLAPPLQQRLQIARDEALRRIVAAAPETPPSETPPSETLASKTPPSETLATVSPSADTGGVEVYVKSDAELWVDEVIAWLDTEPDLEAIKAFWKKDSRAIKALPPDLLAAIKRAKDRAKTRIAGIVTPARISRVATVDNPIDLDDEIKW